MQLWLISGVVTGAQLKGDKLYHAGLPRDKHDKLNPWCAVTTTFNVEGNLYSIEL